MDRFVNGAKPYICQNLTLKHFFCLLFLLSSLAVCSQFAAIDRARASVYSSRTDEARMAGLAAICRLKNSLPGDSIRFYAQWMRQLAIQLNDKGKLALATYNLVSADLAKGKTDSIVDKIDKEPLFVNLEKTDPALYFKVQLLKANALNRLNKRTEALDLQLKILDKAELQGDINTQLFAMNFIGATRLNVNRSEDARAIWWQAVQLIQQTNDPGNAEIEAYIRSNLALYYFNKFSITTSPPVRDSFLTQINTTIALSRQHENLGVLASALAIRGNYYGVTRQFAEGEKDLKDGVAIRKKIGDPLYIINDLISLAGFYYNREQFEQAIAAAKEGIAVADSNHIKGEQIQLVRLMAYAYKALGDYPSYSKMLEEYILLADYKNNVSTAEKIAQVQTQYDVQKKETVIAQQKLDLFQRKLFLYGGAFVTVLLLGYLLFRFKQYQQRERIKNTALREEEKRLNELAVKEAADKERKRIAAELHDNLGVQASAILHSSRLLKGGGGTDTTVITEVQETAKEMLLNLRETLWAMKTTDVTATELWLRVINFMKQMGRHYTALHFKVEGTAAADLIIHSSRALNIVLVLQEAVNNAVKHANASTITAVSTADKNKWCISIKDDGNGFDTAAADEKNESYGLQHMKERAATAGFAFYVNTAPGGGTTVGIEIGE